MKHFTYLLFIVFSAGCSKTSFLDTNPNPSLVVPATLADYQAILDNDLTMNGEAGNGLVPVLGETGADNYYVTPAYYNGFLIPLYQRAYVWEKDVFDNEQIYDWNIPYQSIDRANIVLDGLAVLAVTDDEQNAFNNAEGSALFYRSHLFYQLAQIFAKPYNKDSAAVWPGIPLRLTSSLTEPVMRATLQDTYERIISDLKAAAQLVPAQPIYATRPGKAACYALLARTCLAMQDYDDALSYADSCLQIKNDLIDYNTINANAFYPFTILNAEAVFQCEMIKGPQPVPINPNYFLADSGLYKLYETNDLRKTVFFRPAGSGFYFKGSYSGYNKMFAGIAVDEVYLMQAECEARMGNNTGALHAINMLLEKRYKAGTYIPYTTGNTADALALILTERRKELCLRGLRWTDLRRLNEEGADITLHRRVEGVDYSLTPNDSRYVYPIPQPVIDLNPGMQQNER